MVRELKDIHWGGSGIEKVVFDFILSKVPVGSTVIELGAGAVSTIALNLFYDLHSVEHNTEFISKIGARHIYAPEVNGWYDVEVLKKEMPPSHALVLVDGLYRAEILEHMDLFNPSALFIVHDTFREYEYKLAFDLGHRLKRPVTFYNHGDYWAAI